MFGSMATFRQLLYVAVCFLGSGCASTQLNYNAADLASSLERAARDDIAAPQHPSMHLVS